MPFLENPTTAARVGLAPLDGHGRGRIAGNDTGAIAVLAHQAADVASAACLYVDRPLDVAPGYRGPRLVPPGRPR